MRALMLVLLAALAGCLAPAPAEPAASETSAAVEPTPAPYDFTTAILESGFQHERLEMPVGGIVRWWNVDARVHAVASDDARFPDGPPIEQHAEWAYRFLEAGDYAYHCPYHPEMRAVVVVR